LKWNNDIKRKKNGFPLIEKPGYRVIKVQKRHQRAQKLDFVDVEFYFIISPGREGLVRERA